MSRATNILAKATPSKPAPPVVAGIQIRDEKPPQKKLNGRRANLQPILEAAAKLKPGQWFEYPNPKGTTVTTMKKLVKEQRLSGVDAYRTPDGRVIVICRDPDEFLEDAE